MGVVNSLLIAVKGLYPELRICQILSIAAHHGGWSDNDLFYCPDEVIEKGLNHMIESKSV